MDKIKDGGPAFPLPGWQDVPWPKGTPADFGTGMTLRDYLAAKAMEGLIACGKYRFDAAECAEEAFKFADAMLSARERSTP